MFDNSLASNEAEERPVRSALTRGFRCKCPNCGSGPLLRGYLKLRPTCIVCGEDLSSARADDGPAYLTILIVGHLMAPFMHWIFVAFRPDPIVLATIFCTACVGLSLYLLPRIKGMIVGLQWSKKMHGF
ncbi:DUF983 domain-containing protein [Palleronia abyssalis]|uniref:DUF983 domain-containing protein n=1 Tax=Palleronia abyssalis TaxID=1501240 RepID=A0A2R8BYJ3_9RHOB|nr:DUF983 domain-containing protein [Palleronia abyssalis]SPJ25247.1 hypothetical protein PAA8504_03098 [Palleronia abyssalis]